MRTFTSPSGVGYTVGVGAYVTQLKVPSECFVHSRADSHGSWVAHTPWELGGTYPPLYGNPHFLQIFFE